MLNFEEISQIQNYKYFKKEETEELKRWKENEEKLK